jgi:sulfane dehydrogenase subunit SoxC
MDRETGGDKKQAIDFLRPDGQDQAGFVEAMRLAERQMLAEQRLQECSCKEGMFPKHNRRRVLFAAGGTFAATAAAVLAASARAQMSAMPPVNAAVDLANEPTKVQGRPIGADGGYGLRSGFELERRGRAMSPNDFTAWSMTPLEATLGIITPSGLHFERYRNGVPMIDPARHRLVVHGLVDRPKSYSMADLKRFPSVSRTHFIECDGNSSSEWRVATMKTVQFTHGLLSTSEWTGVPFSTIAREVGLRPGAAWVLAEGSDGAVMTRSVPLDKMMGDAVLAYGQNGEAIRPEQGYPVRLLLPGWEGNINVKWLRRLEVGDRPFMTREETVANADPMPNGKTRRFTFEMEAKSVITFPSGEMRLPAPGFYEITGLGWSGRGKVALVEVSTDGGGSWTAAALQEPILPMSTTRFRFPWFWDGSPATLQSRCVDETGYGQPTRRRLAEVRGFAYHYHNNAIQSWAVAADGSVSNVWI